MLDQQAVAPFLEQAESHHEDQAVAALDALLIMPLDTRVRQRAEEILLERIDRPEGDLILRGRLLEIGARSGSPRITERLRRLLDTPGNPLHIVAAHILADRGDREAGRLLVEILTERLLEEPSAQDAERIAGLDPEILGVETFRRLNRVRSEDIDVRFWLAVARARAGEGDPLLGVLDRMEQGDLSPQVLWGDPWSAERRLAAARPLAPEVVSMLRTLADRDVRDDVRKACWWLTGSRDAEGREKEQGPVTSLDEILDNLGQDPKSTCGNEVLEKVQHLPADTPVPTERLLDIAWSDTPLSQQQVAWILGRRGPERAIPELGEIMARTDDPVRRRKLAEMTTMVTVAVAAEPPWEGSGPSPLGVEAHWAASNASRRRLWSAHQGIPVVDEEAASQGSDGTVDEAVPGDAASRRAWPHLDAPKEIMVEVPFVLEVGLRGDPAPGVTVSGPIDLPRGPVTVRVSVMAHGFELDGSPEITLEVDDANPHPVETLTLTARADPVLAIERRVYAIYSVGPASRAVAERTIRVLTSADEATADADPNTASEELSGASGEAPSATDSMKLREPDPEIEADLTIAIARGNDAAQIGLVWSLVAASVDLPPPPDAEEDRTSSIGRKPEDFLAKIIRKGSETADPFDLYLWLKGTGRSIGQTIPPFVRDAITTVIAARAPEPATILIKSAEPYVPWEMAILDELSDTEDEASPFLGARVQIGRWPLTPPPPPADLPKTMRVERAVAVSGVYDGVPDWNRLPHAEKEAPAVLELCGGGEAVAPDFKKVISSLEGDPAGQVLHFALHGRFERGSTRSGLVLLAPNPKIAGEITEKFLESEHVKGVTMKHHPFVFLNACQVGAGEELLGDYGGLAADFTFAGASAVIAPLWSVHDEVAHQFALAFYAACFDDSLSPAEVLRRRRAGLTKARVQDLGLDGGELSLLAYQLYGHPKYTLTRGAAPPVSDPAASPNPMEP